MPEYYLRLHHLQEAKKQKEVDYEFIRACREAISNLPKKEDVTEAIDIFRFALRNISRAESRIRHELIQQSGLTIGELAKRVSKTKQSVHKTLQNKTLFYSKGVYNKKWYNHAFNLKH